MSALILVDLQNDFLPGGALEVKDGDKIIPLINKLQDYFELIVATQDWHPRNHESFAFWPVHCVQGSKGAEFVKVLDTSKVVKVFQKGIDKKVDSYSGFFDNDKKKSTGLGEYLKEKNIKGVYIVGLATDYCVKYTALDAVRLGFNTFVIEDACRGVNLKQNDIHNAIQEMQSAGVKIINSKEVFKGVY